MRLTIAGSGTAAPEPDRACSGYFLDDGVTRVLLDCGPGVVHHLARFGLPWADLDHVALTHFHNDHLGDLPMLLFALKWGALRRRTAPLTVWGPAGLEARAHHLAAALGDHVLDPGFPLALRELPPGASADLGPGMVLRTAKTPHTDESLAFRVSGADGDLGYTGDTGPSGDVARFLAGSAVLIAECSLPDDDAIPTHLSPSSLAAMAGAAAPGRLVVTHVYPWLDALHPLRLIREAGWAGHAVRAVDGLATDVGA